MRNPNSVRLLPRRALFAALVAALACTQSSVTSDTVLTPTQLKYTLDGSFMIFFCDPDYYPIARGDEQQKAIDSFPAIAADAERFNAILAHLGWSGRTDFTPAEKLAIYREDKRLNAISLTAAGSAYTFELRASNGDKSVDSVSGDIDPHGRVTLRKRTAGFGSCPICLSESTRIATPEGDVAVRELREGVVVWTEDLLGRRIAAPVLRMGHVPVPVSHRFVHLRLSDGRDLLASPGHPTGDGRALGDLVPGDALDGAKVIEAVRLPASGAATYDLLPAGPTGHYWANGILIGSTLVRAKAYATHLQP
jgi:hypothetical protein